MGCRTLRRLVAHGTYQGVNGRRCLGGLSTMLAVGVNKVSCATRTLPDGRPSTLCIPALIMLPGCTLGCPETQSKCIRDTTKAVGCTQVSRAF